jgi:hypothetical protein
MRSCAAFPTRSGNSPALADMLVINSRRVGGIPHRALALTRVTAVWAFLLVSASDLGLTAPKCGFSLSHRSPRLLGPISPSAFRRRGWMPAESTTMCGDEIVERCVDGARRWTPRQPESAASRGPGSNVAVTPYSRGKIRAIKSYKRRKKNSPTIRLPFSNIRQGHPSTKRRCSQTPALIDC